MKLLEIKELFELDLKKIDSMKNLLDNLRSIDFFTGATVKNWETGDQVYFKDDECDWLNDMWSDKINSLIDEIESEEKKFVEKWRIEKNDN